LAGFRPLGGSKTEQGWAGRRPLSRFSAGKKSEEKQRKFVTFRTGLAPGQSDLKTGWS
jgi:hypothetical protein